MPAALESSPDCNESALPTVSQCQVNTYRDNDCLYELTHHETFLYEGDTLTSLVNHFVRHFVRLVSNYRGADKALARPGRKQATATEDFDVHISYL